MVQSVTLLAILLGSGGVVTHGGGELYTLSLPVSREQLLYTRAAVGLGELLLIAFVPSLVIAVMSPAIGERYGLVAALVHATCLFITCAAFFSLALLLSTSYSDVWRPMLITMALGLVLSLAEAVNPTMAQVGVYKLMSGETYFRFGHMPWQGLAIALAVSAGLIAIAVANVVRRDY
jgi:ABC-type transport system involved in multi-copper enzyme maturation permease subunit